MSLINDALKKAARQRAEEQADFTPLMPGGGGSRARQGAPMRTQTMVLIGAAAVVLVVVSVVATGAFVTRGADAKSPSATATVARPVTSVPVQAPSVVTLTIPRIASAVPTSAPVPTAAPVVIAQPTPAPIVAAPIAAAPSSAITAASSGSHSDDVQAFVDALHVTGARAAGTDSKALVDGHVFKLNDLLNKNFGLRLKRVDPDQLTFVDATGATYVRSY